MAGSYKVENQVWGEKLSSRERRAGTPKCSRVAILPCEEPYCTSSESDLFPLNHSKPGHYRTVDKPGLTSAAAKQDSSTQKIHFKVGSCSVTAALSSHFDPASNGLKWALLCKLCRCVYTSSLPYCVRKRPWCPGFELFTWWLGTHGNGHSNSTHFS